MIKNIKVREGRQEDDLNMFLLANILHNNIAALTEVFDWIHFHFLLTTSIDIMQVYTTVNKTIRF